MEKGKYDLIIGWGLLITIGIAFLGGLMGDATGNFYTLVGVGISVFGIWGGIRLIKN